MASVNALRWPRWVHTGSAGGRSAALSAHANPAVTPEYQRIVRARDRRRRRKFISFPDQVQVEKTTRSSRHQRVVFRRSAPPFPAASAAGVWTSRGTRTGNVARPESAPGGHRDRIRCVPSVPSGSCGTSSGGSTSGRSSSGRCRRPRPAEAKHTIALARRGRSRRRRGVTSRPHNT